ncbi:MAG TPA: DUF1707 domain-containing protein [Pseudonocardiaceae bacterium]|jgi:ferric-dicitrate binding protein FerR (iron transport regulator)
MSTTTTEIRASDAEREHVARILRAATGTGLLSLAEVEERLSACYAARYRHELQPLTADLPDTRRLLAQTPQARQATRRRLGGHAALVAVLAALLIVAWAISEAPFFWPVWPIAFLVFGLFRHARRARPGAPA